MLLPKALHAEGGCGTSSASTAHIPPHSRTHNAQAPTLRRTTVAKEPLTEQVGLFWLANTPTWRFDEGVFARRFDEGIFEGGARAAGFKYAWGVAYCLAIPSEELWL